MDRTWDSGGCPGTYLGQIDGQDLGQWGRPGTYQGQIDGQDLGQWGASRYLPGTDRWTGPGTEGGVQVPTRDR